MTDFPISIAPELHEGVEPSTDPRRAGVGENADPIGHLPILLSAAWEVVYQHDHANRDNENPLIDAIETLRRVAQAETDAIEHQMRGTAP